MGEPFLVPGSDSGIGIHGDWPDLYRWVPAGEAIRVHDFRDEPMRFGEDGNNRVLGVAPRLAAPWALIHEAVVSLEGAIYDRRAILAADGAVVLGARNIAWDRALVAPDPGKPHVEAAAAGQMAGDGPVGSPVGGGIDHLPGRTGLVIGKSTHNYYHFIIDILPLVERMVRAAGALGLDRIVINPCVDNPGGFQREIVATLWPDWSDRILFADRPFRADHLSFVCLWPGFFARNGAGAVVAEAGPRGVAGRLIRDSQPMIFERGDVCGGAAVLPAALQGVRAVLVSRAGAAARKIANEADLAARLAPLGVACVRLEDLSFPEKLTLMAGAALVIGPHGAGLVNAGFCRPGATIIEVTARHYLPRATWLSRLGWMRDMHYEVVIGDEDGDIDRMMGNLGNDIRLSPRAIDRVADLVAAAL
ncbi:MAG: glycosyltransferase family 61 protein [Pseudomonadota bacterium]